MIPALYIAILAAFHLLAREVRTSDRMADEWERDDALVAAIAPRRAS